MHGSNALLTHYDGLDLVVFQASGVDTLTFLQSQLTQDVERLKVTDVKPEQSAVLAGYCTAQGKLLADMVLLPGTTENELLGVIKADVLSAFLKRLRMFVLRSKVTLEPVALTASGVAISSDMLDQAENALGYGLPRATWATVATEDGVWVSAPSAESRLLRFWWLADAAQNEAVISRLGCDLATSDDHGAWAVMDLQAGLPWIEADTQDLLIPQTVNLDLIQGVSFTKGCYPGQEVVARAHYRGTVKRRMQLASLTPTESTIKPSDDIFCPADGPNPCGRVVSVARSKDHTWLLFEAPLKLTQANPPAALHAGAVDGPLLAQQPLPYSVLPA